MKITIDKIKPNPYQQRKYFDEQALNELSESIKRDGLMNPITVRKQKEGYEIIAGERRFRACQQLGLKEVDCHLIEADDDKSFQMSLIENIQRDNLSSVELGRAFKEYLDKGHTQEELAKVIDKDQSYISHQLSVLELPEFLQDKLMSRDIFEGHIRQLLRLKPFLKGKKQKYYQMYKGKTDKWFDNFWLPETLLKHGFWMSGNDIRAGKDIYDQRDGYLRYQPLKTEEEMHPETEKFLKGMQKIDGDEINLDWKSRPCKEDDLLNETMVALVYHFEFVNNKFTFIPPTVRELEKEVDWFIYRYYTAQVFGSLIHSLEPFFRANYQVEDIIIDPNNHKLRELTRRTGWEKYKKLSQKEKDKCIKKSMDIVSYFDSYEAKYPNDFEGRTLDYEDEPEYREDFTLVETLSNEVVTANN